MLCGYYRGPSKESSADQSFEKADEEMPLALMGGAKKYQATWNVV